MKPHEVIHHPYVTEKTMAAMDEQNKLEFIVRNEATKPDIKRAIEVLFEADVAKVNTQVGMDGRKHAIIKFAPDVSAEDVGMRIGIF